MLLIINNLRELDFSQLMQIYEEGNRESGLERYSHVSAAEQLLLAEQDFYAYLRVFFKNPDSLYAIWVNNGCYVSALRLEPYSDGLLLEALETIPNQRRRGFAKRLMLHVMEYLSQQGNCKVYSHIHKNNTQSLNLHKDCGFTKTLEHAVYIDGSVLHSSCTMEKVIKKTCRQ